MTSAAQSILLPQWLHDQIVAHAREGKPEEICGIVRGRGPLALQALRARNIAAERIENYTVDPQTLLLQFEFEDAGDEMTAIYHSHPVSPAYPSATDAWNAHYPEAIYLICSLEFDEAPVVRAWRLVTEDAALEWETLVRELPFAEVRPGLWGWYAGESAPSSMRMGAGAIAPPFYLVYARDADGTLDGRLVSVRECTIVVQA